MAHSKKKQNKTTLNTSRFAQDLAKAAGELLGFDGLRHAALVAFRCLAGRRDEGRKNGFKAEKTWFKAEKNRKKHVFFLV